MNKLPTCHVSSMQQRIYLDYNSTGRIDARHYDEVVAELRASDGNPSSIHSFGRSAKVAVEAARVAVGDLLGVRSLEVAFTSGATEANNLALRGVLDRWGRHGDEKSSTIRVDSGLPVVIVSAAEHSSVLETTEVLAERGICVAIKIGVESNGRVRESELLEAVATHQASGRLAAVALIHVNNETGAINPVGKLAQKIRKLAPSVHVHTDAVQSLGKLDLRWLGDSEVNSAAFSAHKINAFKGVGALWIKSGVKLATQMTGGGQERARRAGTENVPGIVSFGIRAKEIAADKELTYIELFRPLQLQLIKGLDAISGAVVHGEPGIAVANTVNFHVDGIPGDDLLLNLDIAGIAASSGSACSSGVGRPSHVLASMGLGEWVALNSVRISFGPGSEASDVDKLLDVVRTVVARKRK